MKISNKNRKKIKAQAVNARVILDHIQNDVFLKEAAHKELDRIYSALTLIELICTKED